MRSKRPGHALKAPMKVRVIKFTEILRSFICMAVIKGRSKNPQLGATSHLWYFMYLLIYIYLQPTPGSGSKHQVLRHIHPVENSAAIQNHSQDLNLFLGAFRELLRQKGHFRTFLWTGQERTTNFPVGKGSQSQRIQTPSIGNVPSVAGLIPKTTTMKFYSVASDWTTVTFR